MCTRRPWVIGRRATVPALAALVLAGCGEEAGKPALPASACETAAPISRVQGSAYRSPMEGEPARVRGVVTATTSEGLYLESDQPDANAETSEGLFIASPALVGQHAVGDIVTFSGTVRERGQGPDTLTSLAEVGGIRRCGRTPTPPLTAAQLPMGPARRESLEAMRLSIHQSLMVSDVYGLRQGDIRISLDGILPAPTEVARPGGDALAVASRNRERSMALRLAGDEHPGFPIGTRTSSLRGVFGHDGRQARLLLEDDPGFAPPTLYRIEPPQDGHLRVVSFNLHNYFNGDGAGGGFPTPRGAATPREYAEQRTRLVAALRRMQPHLVAVQELENDGFGPASAASDFIADLNSALPGPWRVVEPGRERIGDDAITVGLFYREDHLTPLGPAEILEARPFQGRSRVPLAQAFTDPVSGHSVLVAVNHFKSKGSCPRSGPDADQGDGQGCWNPTRLASAEALIGWVNRLATTHTGGKALIVGDLNAYRMEEPVRLIAEAGYSDLTAYAAFGFEYSFVFRGEAGTLDYAFASAPLERLVWRAEILNINAGYPPDVPLEHDFLRSSDHDPVLVDLRLRQPATDF